MPTVTPNDGTTIAYSHRGAGPLGPLVPPLAEHFTVYTYDRRGRGESTDTAPYAIDREVEDLAALIDAAGGAAALFGVSSGAVLALFAAARGLPVRRLA